MISSIQRTPGSGCMYEPCAYQPVQSLQARTLEFCRRNHEASLRRFGPDHRVTKSFLKQCQLEAGFIISGVYCSGRRGWGNV